MTGIMMAHSSLKRNLVADPKVWTGITSGLQFNLLNAPGSGTLWVDDSGNGRNATLQGSPSYVYANGGGTKLNNATYGGTDYISVPYNIASSTVTIEIVASFNPTSSWATVWGNDSYLASSGYFAYMTSGTSMTWGKVPGSTSATITASNSIRHWVWVINGTQYLLYLNGSQLGTTFTQSPAQTSFVNTEFYFGARHSNNGVGPADKMNNSTPSLQPVFHQMRVYNTALSAANVTTNYAAVKSSVTGGYGLP
jgi:hypothetical protein